VRLLPTYHPTEVRDCGPRPGGRRRGQSAPTAELCCGDRQYTDGGRRGRVFVMFADLI